MWGERAGTAQGGKLDVSIIREATKDRMVADINTALEEGFGRIHALGIGSAGVAAKVEAMQVLYALQDRFLEIIRPCLTGVEFQCRRGCAHCCEFRVEVMPVEALRIAAHLRDQGDGARWIRVLEAHSRYARGRTELDYQKPCPFMDAEGACGIYEVRPYKCRVYHSLDAEACRKHRKNYGVGLLDQLESMVVQGLRQVFSQGRLSLAPSELGQSVLQALTDPEAGAQWLAGGEPFLEPGIRHRVAQA